MNAYCPTCGCSGIRWAGCPDDFHHGIPDEQPFVPYNETDPASALTLKRGPEHRQPVVEVPHV